MESERDELYGSFTLAVEEVKQSCGVKNILLEKRIASLGEELDRAKIARMAEADGVAKEGMIGPSEIEVSRTNIF